MARAGTPSWVRPPGRQRGHALDLPATGFIPGNFVFALDKLTLRARWSLLTATPSHGCSRWPLRLRDDGQANGFALGLTGSCFSS